MNRSKASATPRSQINGNAEEEEEFPEPEEGADPYHWEAPEDDTQDNGYIAFQLWSCFYQMLKVRNTLQEEPVL